VNGALSLKARFPYMFVGQHAGLTFYRGWTPALSRACEQIDGLLPSGKFGFRWVQIGEDHGSGLFFYVLGGRRTLAVKIRGDSRRALLVGADEVGTPEVSSELDLLILEAERMTCTSCMVCGHRGDFSFHFGRALTVCNVHTPEALNLRGEEGLEGFWRAAVEWEEAPSI